jgi:galactokinase
MAIGRATWIALRPRTDRTVVLHSMHHQETRSFPLDDVKKESGWQEYPKGVAWALQESGVSLGGWEGTTLCDVPLGAGLSSSASFELAVARAFACVTPLDWDAPAMARLGQRAENQWVGVNCGIMDQMISAVGREGHAVLIDCRELSFRHVPLPPGAAIVVMDTATRRGLVDSAYNERRCQCEQAAEWFGVKFLRDVSEDEFATRAHELDATTRKRARHVITENARTLQAGDRMQAGDAEGLGRLMNASHASLRDDFEVTNTELDLIVQIARKTKGCLGARMTGAGFGGCAVALVREEVATDFSAGVSMAYEKASGLHASLYVCTPAEGASVAFSAPS